MKRNVPEATAKKYRLPAQLTEFQLSMYIHLIEWKWKHITKEPGVYHGHEYDAILPKPFQDDLHPLYRPIVKEIRGSHEFKSHNYFGHMASSQAACINLFAPLLLDSDVANQVLPHINPRFSRLAIDKLEQGFQFEFWDQRNLLKDHNRASGTDSDLAIAYYDVDNRLCLWLIEHKLTESEFTTCGGYRSNGNTKKENCRNGEAILGDPSRCYYKYGCGYRYWDFMANTDYYDRTALAESARCPFMYGTNQLWRNQMMGEAVRSQGEYERVHLSVVHHPDNPDLDGTIEDYERLLKDDQSVFDSFTSKDVVEAAKHVSNQRVWEWAEWYADLYRIR